MTHICKNGKAGFSIQLCVKVSTCFHSELGKSDHPLETNSLNTVETQISVCFFKEPNKHNALNSQSASYWGYLPTYKNSRGEYDLKETKTLYKTTKY